MIITDMGNGVGNMTLRTYVPNYLKYMLGVNIKTNGFLSGLPMLSRYLGGVFQAASADYLFTKLGWSVSWIRRVFNSFCMCGPAIGKKCSSYQICWLFLRGFFSALYFEFFDAKSLLIAMLTNQNKLNLCYYYN